MLTIDRALLNTTIHEAAHASVAASLGQAVASLSIAPEPPRDPFPGTLGHVCLFPLYSPCDTALSRYSAWVEHACMVDLAGYTLGQIAMPDQYFVPATHRYNDFGSVGAIMRCVASHDAPGTVTAVAALKCKVARFMAMPVVYQRIVRTAALLLQRTTVSGEDFGARILQGQCGLIHPDLPDYRCRRGPNQHDFHASRSAPSKYWIYRPYDPEPYARRPDGYKPPAAGIVELRRLRQVNVGGHGYPLTKPWIAAIDDYARLPAPEIDEHTAPLARIVGDVMDEVASHV